MGNKHSCFNKKKSEILKRFIVTIKENQVNFFLKQKRLHIFRTKGFIHNSWKYNLIEDMENSNENNFIIKWRDEIKNYLRNCGFSEIESQAAIFFNMMELNMTNSISISKKKVFHFLSKKKKAILKKLNLIPFTKKSIKQLFKK